MSARMRLLSFAVSAVVFLTTSLAWALIEVGGTKDELRMDYDVLVQDIKNDNLSISFTLTDEGRMKPLSYAQLIVKSEAERGLDLSLRLAMETVKGKQTAHFQMKRNMAERATILLVAKRSDSNRKSSDGHAIRIADYLDSPGPEKNEAAVTPESSQKASK